MTPMGPTAGIGVDPCFPGRFIAGGGHLGAVLAGGLKLKTLGLDLAQGKATRLL